MREIDEMDMLGFLRIRAWSAMQEQKKKEPKHAYIDEVWPDLKQNTLQFCAWIKMSCYDAAKKLANDFNIQPLPPGQSASIPKLPASIIERKEEQRVLKILVEYEQLLEKWKEEYAPSDPMDENPDNRFVHAVHFMPPLSDAIDRLFSSNSNERKAIMERIRSTDAVAKIKEIFNEGCQEVKNDGPEKDRAA